MSENFQDLERRLRALENACSLQVSAELLAQVIKSLEEGESLGHFTEQALQKELQQRGVSIAKPSEMEQVSSGPSIIQSAVPGEIPIIAKEMPIKTHDEDLSKLDRQVIESIVLRELASGLLKEHMDAIPRTLHALMEYDVVSSHWFPREDWNELMHDFLDNGLNYTLDSWIEMRRQKRLEEEADAWIQLGREDD